MQDSERVIADLADTVNTMYDDLRDARADFKVQLQLKDVEIKTLKDKLRFAEDTIAQYRKPKLQPIARRR
ncbi:MAG: hypothetical protein HQK96_08060 [Nitrospirae bacterium]|nr:hypothetical protein [Nitrospirota bacterium]